MRAGKLKHTIIIQRGNNTKVGPHAVPTWTNFATVRAEMVSFAASEFATGFGEAEKGTVIFRIRFLAGVTTADQIAHDGRAYDLKDIVTIENGRGLELRAVAVS